MTPPRLAESVFAWSLPAADREVVLGDLAEEFRQRAATAGMRAARRWYWRQCRVSFASNLRGRRDASREASAGPAPRPAFHRLFNGTRSDIRGAVRSWQGSPGVTTIALVVLTLGIGAGTAVFSVVDAVVLRDLPFTRSHDLMVLNQDTRSDGQLRVGAVTPQDYLDLAAGQDVFSGFGAAAAPTRTTVDGSEPSSVRTQRVTASLFSALYMSPRRGAMFTTANEAAGADRVAVLSDAFWRRQFGGDPDVVGRAMTMDGASWRIIGVLPPGVIFPVSQPSDVFVPYVVPAAERVRAGRHASYLQVIARLRAGIDAARAQARITAMTRGLAAQFPDWFRNRQITVRPLRDTIVGAGVRSWMLMLLSAVGFVLLIACANVASLALAQATARGRDMGVRAALGASRWRLIRASLIESLMLSAAGTALGVAAAWTGIGVIRAVLPANLPRAAAIGVNWRVLAAAAAAAIVTGLVCGVLPALHGSRADVAGALRESGRANSAGRSRQRLRVLLVVAEVGLAVVLLVGAGLFMSSFIRLTSVDLGLNYQHVLTLNVTPAAGASRESRAAADQRIPAIVNRVLPILRSMPGVVAVAALSGTRPFEGGSDSTNITVRGREDDFKGPEDAVQVYRVTPDYLKAIGVSLVKGRTWRPDETGPDARAVVLNETAAARFFLGADPIGQPVGLLGDREIVGIVHDIRTGGPETEVKPEAYLSFAAGWAPSAFVTIRTEGNPLRMVPAVKTVVRSIAPDLPISDVETLEGFLGGLVAQRKFNMVLIGVFGLLALTIASVGIFGVMAFLVEQRRAEMGLRMALGAQARDVLGLVLRSAIGILGVGIGAGVVAAWLLSGTLRAFLFRVQPHNAVVYAGAAGVLMAAGLLAAFGPARRASRIDPIIALRAD